MPYWHGDKCSNKTESFLCIIFLSKSYKQTWKELPQGFVGISVMLEIRTIVFPELNLNTMKKAAQRFDCMVQEATQKIFMQIQTSFIGKNLLLVTWHSSPHTRLRVCLHIEQILAFSCPICVFFEMNSPPPSIRCLEHKYLVRETIQIPQL